ncbi:MAG: YkgJ family cysteine cluster protein [Byssovorax sp.]
MAKPSASRDNASTALLTALAEVYAAADAVFAGWACPASTECCRFGVTGREPYVTSIELLAVRRALAARGGPRSFPRAGPLAPAEGAGRVRLPRADGERRCPLLDRDGRCAVYADRPLGCRTFYCDRASEGGRVRHREIGALVRRIQDIALRHRAGGDIGRPLTRALDDPSFG